MNPSLENAKSRIGALNINIVKGAEYDILRGALREKFLDDIQCLVPEDLEEILTDLQKTLNIIASVSVKDHARVSLLAAKSEILTFMGIIHGRLGKFESAFGCLEEAMDIEKIISASVSVKTDWAFLDIQISAGFFPRDAVERLKINLPVLVEYFQKTGNEKLRIRAWQQLLKVKSLKPCNLVEIR